MNQTEATFWRRCNICKKEIGFRTKHYLCSVSTCRGKRTGLTFCSVECWDAHLGFANHRTSFAEEALSPTREAFMSGHEENNEIGSREPQRHVVSDVAMNDGSPAALRAATLAESSDALIVVSKVKKLVREEGDLNTSECAIKALTQKVIEECLKGIERAKSSGRKTFMGRDIL